MASESSSRSEHPPREPGCLLCLRCRGVGRIRVAKSAVVSTSSAPSFITFSSPADHGTSRASKSTERAHENLLRCQALW